MKVASIIRAVVKILRHPFGQQGLRDEYRQRSRRHLMLSRISTLEMAVERGAQVADELEQARRELADLEAGFPRGHTACYVAVCAWFAATLTALVTAYSGLQPLFLEIWETPDCWYLQRFRPGTAWVWRATAPLMLSPWSLPIPIALLAIVWVAQRRLPRWHARTLLGAVVVVETLLVLAVTMALFRLLMSPLG